MLKITLEFNTLEELIAFQQRNGYEISMTKGGECIRGGANDGPAEEKPGRGRKKKEVTEPAPAQDKKEERALYQVNYQRKKKKRKPLSLEEYRDRKEKHLPMMVDL